MNNGNSNDSRLDEQFANLGIKGKPTAGRYVPPHMRNKSANNIDTTNDNTTTTIINTSSASQERITISSTTPASSNYRNIATITTTPPDNNSYYNNNDVNNNYYNNESDELVPPLQSRRSNNGWHTRNESAAPAVNWDTRQTSFPRPDAWGGSRSEMGYSSSSRGGWNDRASSQGENWNSGYRNTGSNSGGAGRNSHRGGNFAADDFYNRRDNDGYGSWHEGAHTIAPKKSKIRKGSFW